MAKAAFNMKSLFTSNLELNLLKKLGKCHIWSRAFYGAETWTLWKVGKKYLESFETWHCRKMVKIGRTDRVRNEEVLQRVKYDRNITKGLKKNLEAIPRKHSTDSLQKTARLGTSPIIWNILQSETLSLSGGHRHWFKRNNRKKKPVTRDNSIIIIILYLLLKQLY